MATIVFQAAGAALGGIFGPLGAMIGRAAGALAGNAIDRTLLSNGRTVTGARLSTARIPGADEGAAISRLYGTARIGGRRVLKKASRWSAAAARATVARRSKPFVILPMSPSACAKVRRPWCGVSGPMGGSWT